MREVYLIVGLGNPGEQYEKTRHNLGFMVMDALAKKYAAHFQKKRTLKGEIALAGVDDKQLCLLKPHTYMNLSGEAVKKTMDYYHIPLQQCIVVVDDCDLPFGKFRLRTKGGAGGHKGLKNIEEVLGLQDYLRLRGGVGKPLHGDLEEFVLQPFTSLEKQSLPLVLETGVSILETWVKIGTEKAVEMAASFDISQKQKGLE